jgi:predicted HAD superfamily phosphohydrolase
MESLSINIINPIAKNILDNLEKLNIIEIKKNNIEEDFFKKLEDIRSKDINISLDEIVDEVKIVRKKGENNSPFH